jgi:hypothetical protein
MPLKRFVAHYQYCDLRVEQVSVSPEEWEIWIEFWAGKSDGTGSIRVQTAKLHRYRTENDAKRDVLAWVRNQYLGWPCPDEPKWQEAERSEQG